MTTVTVRLNEEENELFNEYAKLYNMPLSTLLKQALENQIQDEMDLKIIKDYEASDDFNDNTYYNHDEVKKILGI